MESHIQQLDMDLCQLRKSIQELHSQLIKLDDQEADLSHELHQLHSVIDNERCRDAVQKLVVLLEQLKDLEGQESGLESNLLVCEEEISNLSRTKCGSIDMDNRLIDSSNKLNLLKRKLEKAKLDLLAELQLCDSLKEKHTVAIAELHYFSDLLKTFQDACTKYERLQELALT